MIWISFHGAALAADMERDAHLHSDACMLETWRVLAAYIDYLAQWPHHCHACQGEGGTTYYGEDQPEFVLCHECVERGLCPRCGRETINDDADEPCRVCSWDPLGVTSDDIAPPERLECWGDCQEDGDAA